MAISRGTRPSGDSSDGKFVTTGTGEAKRLATFWEFLTETTYDDQTPRKTASMTIFVADACLKCVLNDKDMGRSLWAESDSLMGLFDELEGMLRSPAPQWRWDRSDSGGSKASRKK